MLWIGVKARELLHEVAASAFRKSTNYQDGLLDLTNSYSVPDKGRFWQIKKVD